MKKIGLLIMGVVVAYAAYPYWSLYRLGKALEVEDEGSLKHYVDWPAVRSGLKEDISGMLSRNAGRAIASGDGAEPLSGIFAATVGNAMLEPLIDALVTPQGLAAMIREGHTKEGEPTSEGQSTRREGDLSERLSFAFFTGPAAFEAVFETEEGDDVAAVMQLNGLRWQLVRLRLPDSQAQVASGTEPVGGAQDQTQKPRSALEQDVERLTAQLTQLDTEVARLSEQIQTAEESRTQSERKLAQIEIKNTKYYWSADPFSQPVIEFTIKNTLDVALARVLFHGVLETPGRSVPWVNDSFNYQFPGGIEPGRSNTFV
jgi:outer membrane murein-binding lipoprotein Lpp